MNTSLEKLVKTLRAGDFIFTRSVFGDRWEFVRPKWPTLMKHSKKFSEYDKPLTDVIVEDFYPIST